MSRFPSPYQSGRPQPFEATEAFNGATVRFFNSVYAWMSAGLAVTALVAWWVSQSPALVVSISHWWILLLVAEIVLVMGISAGIQRIGAAAGTALFMLFAAINGLVLSSIFLAYSTGTLASAFVVSAGTFAVMSVFGMVTKRDLTSVGRIAYMALIGLIIATIVSFFWHNSMLAVAINYIGVLVFVALTAYDTQKLQQMAIQIGDNPALAARMSVVGSLVLYLDFINLFLFIVQIMGGNRRR
jgi:FtsH-binding integral membrane protein